MIITKGSMILGQLKGLAVAELLILMYLKTSVAIKRERGRKWQTDLPCVSARPGRWNRGQTCPHEPPFPWTGLTVLQGRCRGFESEALTALIFLCSPCVCVCVCVHAQLRQTLWPHGWWPIRLLEIFQASLLAWVAIPSPRGSFLPRDRTHVSRTSRWIFYHWVS